MADALGRALAVQWASQGTKTTSLQSRPFEFSRVPAAKGVTDPYWTAFIQRVKHAAAQAGFGGNVACKLAGSFFELADNIWEHSGAPQTAVVGYRREAGRFEFVIADGGLGVVASLNRRPEFANLTDAGTALQTALALADTQYGKRSGRGDGYRNMFANLMNLSGTVRVRSEDHGIIMDGASPSLRLATTFQTVYHQGFIVSVTCRL
jgi:anti-sigma regulatory factor (Ser/Thr protein kinase)